LQRVDGHLAVGVLVRGEGRVADDGIGVERVGDELVLIPAAVGAATDLLAERTLPGVDVNVSVLQVSRK
jgi:hypothetical protein